ncbi:MAG: 3-keto-5-aminohexanoate cleavage protein [Pseudomonadota bacterium]
MPTSVIVTCAPTGGIHIPSMSPHVPTTPAGIATVSIQTAEAGASILQLYARDPETGKPGYRQELFAQVLPAIKKSTDAVIKVSAASGLGMSIGGRLLAASTAGPEMANLNMGSMNFGVFPMLRRYTGFQYAWVRPCWK